MKLQFPPFQDFRTKPTASSGLLGEPALGTAGGLTGSPPLHSTLPGSLTLKDQDVKLLGPVFPPRRLH